MSLPLEDVLDFEAKIRLLSVRRITLAEVLRLSTSPLVGDRGLEVLLADRGLKGGEAGVNEVGVVDSDEVLSLLERLRNLLAKPFLPEASLSSVGEIGCEVGAPARSEIPVSLSVRRWLRLKVLFPECCVGVRWLAAKR